MALTGTLKDFGIADILQLIGQQQKSGVLHLRGKDKSVNVHFVDGNVVKAESTSRSRKDLLGSMLVRAQVIDQAQLDRALELQRQSLRRLGDILVDERLVSRELFREMYQLQTTETLYRLFHWKDGTYEFEQEDVDYDREAITPIRSENVLMEGFRMVDEWPMIRRRITSYDMSFVRLKALDAGGGDGQAAAFDGGDDADIDSAFGAALSGEKSAPSPRAGSELGAIERSVYELAEPERTVQEIIDRSRLGEFESCKSLLSLVEAGYLAGVEPARKGKPLIGGRAEALLTIRSAVMNIVMGFVVLALVAAATWATIQKGESGGELLESRSAFEILAQEQEGLLRRALALFFLERGEYPDQLEKLVDAGILEAHDLNFPYRSKWTYFRSDALSLLLEEELRGEPVVVKESDTDSLLEEKNQGKKAVRHRGRGRPSAAPSAPQVSQAERETQRIKLKVLAEIGAMRGEPYLLLSPLP